jgi:hypothetical protein
LPIPSLVICTKYSVTCVTRSLILYVCFVDRCLSFCTFSFGHLVACSSSIYGFWLPLWYLKFCWKVDFLTTQQLTLEKCGKGRIEYTGDMQRCLNYAIINTISATIRIRHYVMKITRKANNYHTVGKKRFKQWWSTIHLFFKPVVNGRFWRLETS